MESLSSSCCRVKNSECALGLTRLCRYFFFFFLLPAMECLAKFGVAGIDFSLSFPLASSCSPSLFSSSHSSFIIESFRIVLSKESLSRVFFFNIFLFYTYRDLAVKCLWKGSSSSNCIFCFSPIWRHRSAIIFHDIVYIFSRIVYVGDNCSLMWIGGIIAYILRNDVVVFLRVRFAIHTSHARTDRCWQK